MDLTTEAFLTVIGYQTSATSSEVRVVVCAIKQVVNTTFSTDGSKESSHVILFCLLFTVYDLQLITSKDRTALLAYY